MDGCLALWAPAEFQARAEEMKEQAKGSPVERNMARVFFAGAQEASPDRQGRIAIPANLREFADLTRSGQVVVTGAWDHVEIWDVARLGAGPRGRASALRGPRQPASAAHQGRQHEQQDGLRPCATLRPESGKTPLFAPSTAGNGSRRPRSEGCGWAQPMDADGETTPSTSR